MNFCIQCGKALQSKKDEGFKRWTCESCGWIFYNNPRPCATAVIGNSGKILLTKRAINPGKNLWDLPGGFMEDGEHPEEALAREICEELGVGLKSTELLGFYPDQYGQDNIPILNITYCCDIEGEPVPCDQEFKEIRWFDLAELPGDYAFSSVQAMMDDCIEKRRGI